MKYPHIGDSVVIKRIEEDDRRGVFHYEGLYTGYGVTAGNALRRVLLSSIPGAAITKMKIQNVDHEFSTLPGMVEDIVEFSLNLKKVRFHFFADEAQALTLHIKGEREVTAGDIKETAFVKVVNPELHIATLTKKNAELEVELTIEKGIGYVPAESRRLERLQIGTIILDAIFSPLTRVEFAVENMRVGDRTDYNRLKIEIETDGSITPSEALVRGATILRDHFERFTGLTVRNLATAGTSEQETKEKEKESASGEKQEKKKKITKKIKK